MRRDLNIIKMSGTFVLYGYIIRYEQMFVNGFERKSKACQVSFHKNMIAGILEIERIPAIIF